MNPFYNKRKKGYTLAEVLATVAILLILMAIAVPAIFSIRKNLRAGSG
ncbi:MAG: type IV pilin protein [Ruminococcus sp.]